MSKVKTKKKLLRGRYYWHRDESEPGLHPSYIYKKYDKYNKYNIICFTTKNGKKRYKLNKNINPNSSEPCYVHKTPRVAKRKSFGSELKGYKVTDYRDKALIETIKRKKK